MGILHIFYILHGESSLEKQYIHVSPYSLQSSAYKLVNYPQPSGDNMKFGHIYI